MILIKTSLDNNTSLFLVHTELKHRSCCLYLFQEEIDNQLLVMSVDIVARNTKQLEYLQVLFLGKFLVLIAFAKATSQVLDNFLVDEIGGEELIAKEQLF